MVWGVWLLRAQGGSRAADVKSPGHGGGLCGLVRVFTLAVGTGHWGRPGARHLRRLGQESGEAHVAGACRVWGVTAQTEHPWAPRRGEARPSSHLSRGQAPEPGQLRGLSWEEALLHFWGSFRYKCRPV